MYIYNKAQCCSIIHFFTVTFCDINMTSLSFSDIFHNPMYFNTRDGLLYRTAVRFSTLFKKNSIRYYIVGEYALIFHQRNTMDIDIIVHEDDFQKAIQVILLSNSFNKVNEAQIFLPLFVVVSNYKNRFLECFRFFMIMSIRKSLVMDYLDVYSVDFFLSIDRSVSPVKILIQLQ